MTSTLLLVIALLGQDGAVNKDLAKMQGAWQLVSGEGDGEAASEYVIEHPQTVIKKDQLTFKGVEPLTDKFSRLTLKLDASTNPRCIDLKVEAGSMKGSVLEGVYEWKGEELKMCFSLAGGNRPLDFEARSGSNRVLLVLKRRQQ
jgi:uncharacterized protein (TIGR03067 family)